MADRAVNLPRRRLIQAVLAGAAGRSLPGTSGSAKAQAHWAQAKMSKREAEYQDAPKDIRMCATCTLFEPPRSCKVVEGDVSPDGWCKAFALAD
jgi:hypothetical protein